MKLKIYSMLTSLFMITACSEDLEISKAPEFEVSTAKDTYKVGEPVKFIFSGNPDMISFYSGNPLNDYAFREGRLVDIASQGATLDFTSAVSGGTQAGQLSILASTDFNGNYSDWTSIKTATWKDITSRFTLGTSSTFLASTKQDISDLLVAGKPIYFAFKYITKPQATNGLARTWMIEKLAVTSKATLGINALVIADQLRAGFRIADENKANAPARSLVSPTRITLLGNEYLTAAHPIFDPANPIYVVGSPTYDPKAVRPTFNPASPYNDPLSENWAISTAIYPDKIDLGPDRAVAIKGRDTKVTDYTFSYSTPGTYQVAFVASNNSISVEKKVVKAVTLTITP